MKLSGFKFRANAAHPLVAIAVAIILSLFSLSIDAAELTGVGVRPGAQVGQLSILLKGDVQKPRAFSIGNPYRVIVDLPNTRVKSQQAVRSIQNARGYGIRNIRYGVLRSHDLRLVLDMEGSTQYQPQLVKRAGGIRLTFVSPRTTRQSSAAPVASNRTPSEEASSNGRRNVVIVIDPGHGGKDSGTIGADGTYEKNVVLPIGRDVARNINAETGFESFLTRKGDYYLTLPQRVEIARQHKADFFISIHANAVDSRTPHGTIVFALSEHGATSTMASWMARRENTSSMLGGGGAGFLDLSGDSIPLRQTLIDLSLSSKTAQSVQAGDDLVSHIRRVNHMFTNRVERANFAVLRSPDIPSVLIETDFLSNIPARQRLKSPAFQRQLAAQIAAGITQWFKQHPPHGTWLAYRQEHPGTTLKPVKAPQGNVTASPVSSRLPDRYYRHYVVKNGDSLSRIATRYHTTMARIQSANNLNSQNVSVGQHIKIPR